MLDITQTGTSSSGKTNVYTVNSGELKLGTISFFGRWRKYCFYPNEGMLFDHLCLTEIADFCKKQTNIVFKR